MRLEPSHDETRNCRMEIDEFSGKKLVIRTGQVVFLIKTSDIVNLCISGVKSRYKSETRRRLLHHATPASAALCSTAILRSEAFSLQ
jgi:hypothetical protein